VIAVEHRSSLPQRFVTSIGDKIVVTMATTAIATVRDKMLFA
jgi:hypothetical protein